MGRVLADVFTVSPVGGPTLNSATKVQCSDQGKLVSLSIRYEIVPDGEIGRDEYEISTSGWIRISKANRERFASEAYRHNWTPA